MKALVCGGRHYQAQWIVDGVLSAIHSRRPITLLVHGAADGADACAKRWANDNEVLDDPNPANWDLGRKGGPVRNGEMLVKHPDIKCVIAFPGDRGTADMVDRAKAAGIRVIQITDTGYGK